MKDTTFILAQETAAQRAMPAKKGRRRPYVPPSAKEIKDFIEGKINMKLSRFRESFEKYNQSK